MAAEAWAFLKSSESHSYQGRPLILTVNHFTTDVPRRSGRDVRQRAKTRSANHLRSEPDICLINNPKVAVK